MNKEMMIEFLKGDINYLKKQITGDISYLCYNELLKEIEEKEQKLKELMEEE